MASSESLKGIAPFVYAADSGSFASAAERLNLTSSAVSKSIARLEERLVVIQHHQAALRAQQLQQQRESLGICLRRS